MMNEGKRFEPMLAAKTPTEALMGRVDAHWPMLGSPKYDGIRFFVEDEVVYSRTRIPIRSAFVQKMYGRSEFNGIDGELIAGLPYGPNVYDRTFSAVMTIGAVEPVNVYVFDRMEEGRYYERHTFLCEWYKNLPREYDDLVVLVDQQPLKGWNDALEFESRVLAQGYEGAMLRHPHKEYKLGRATLIGGELIKLKRYMTAEAAIEGFEELLHNNNEPSISGIGRTKRSVNTEGMIPGDTLGAIIARDIKTSVEMRVGSGEGMDFSLRKWIWDNRKVCLGRIFRYKYLGYGEKYRPRHPQWNGWRDLMDIT